MSDDLWGPIDPEKWREVGHTHGRLASEPDVVTGHAVFFAETGPNRVPHVVHRMLLPIPAILHDTTSGQSLPVIVIQAEQGPNGVNVGYRPMSGGNGICLLDELELLPDIDVRFRTL